MLTQDEARDLLIVLTPQIRESQRVLQLAASLQKIVKAQGGEGTPPNAKSRTDTDTEQPSD